MTNTTLPDEVLKTDVLGRVRTPAERREALLEEFARSGVSGRKFAALVGINYQTFASWVQQRRQARGRTKPLSMFAQAASVESSRKISVAIRDIGFSLLNPRKHRRHARKTVGMTAWLFVRRKALAAMVVAPTSQGDDFIPAFPRSNSRF